MWSRCSCGAAAAFLLVAWAGCATVHPWEREHLASRALADPFAESEIDSEYHAKLIESRTAGGSPGTAPGGGCGCTQ